MIIHIDHIALTSNNFEKDINFLETLGYKKRFLEKNIINLDIKKKLLRNPVDLHDLSLLDFSENFSIEVLHYKNNTLPNSYFIPSIEFSNSCVFSSVLSDLKPKCQNVSFFLFNKLFAQVQCLENALKFWNNLGFKCINVKEKELVLSFTSLLNRQTYYLYLQENSDIPRNIYLDDIGFNSIAFITTSAERERESFIKKGLFVTEINELVVNGKALKIFFVTGDNGEMVEIIGFEK